MIKTVLITGAGGFLGSRLSSYLSGKKEYEVVPVTHRELDITDSVVVSAFFKAVRPEYVIHCAAVSDTRQCEENPVLSERVNVVGTSNLARACREMGSKMIFMSSDQIYGGSVSHKPGRETDRVKPVNVYGRDKKKGEDQMLSLLTNGVALRLTWMYDYPEPAETAVRRDLLTRLLTVREKDTMDSFPIYDRRGITYVWDVVRRIEDAMRLPGGVYNFGSEATKSLYETALEFAEIMRIQEPEGRILPDRRSFSSMPRNLTMDMTKANAQGIRLGDSIGGLVRCGRDHGENWERKEPQSC